MARTALELVNHVEHAAEGDLDPRLDPLRIVNDAGRYLCAMHEWTWLERPPANLSFVADTDYVVLPTDFNQMISVEPTSSIVIQVFMTTISTLLKLRADQVTSVFDYTVALEYPTQSATTARPGSARLAVYPTPGSNDSNVLKLFYKAGWIELDGNADVPNTPEDCDSLLIEIIRQMTLGYTASKAGGDSVRKRIEGLRESELFKTFARRYGADSWDLGQMQGGIVNRGPYPIYRPHSTIART
jgi:hypothetical protein